MKPHEIESMIERMVGRENYTGLKAREMKRKYGTTGYKDADIFDCDDRAELARRMAEKHGYQTMAGVQMKAPGEYHRYLKLFDKDKNEHEILKLKDMAQKR